MQAFFLSWSRIVSYQLNGTDAPLLRSWDVRAGIELNMSVAGKTSIPHYDMPFLSTLDIIIIIIIIII